MAAHAGSRSRPATFSTARARPGSRRRSPARPESARPAVPESARVKLKWRPATGLRTRKSRPATCSPASPFRSVTGSRWITTHSFANRASMLTTDARARGLADLPPVQSDSLLQLIALCNADPRAEKIDVGVGVWRDGAGNTPILKTIKAAEQRLVDTQASTSYLGGAGDRRFAELPRPILLGPHAADERIAGVQ